MVAAMTATRTAFSLLRRPSLGRPRLAVAQLHFSSPIFREANNSEKPPASRPDNSTTLNPIPNSSDNTKDKAAPFTENSPKESDQKPCLTSSSNDTNPLHTAEYQAFRGRQSTGPFTWKAATLFLLTGTGLIVYFRLEKKRMDRLRIAEENKEIGTPRIGGPYTLIDHNGQKVSQDTYAGKHTLIYFGFTRCPDICPEELDKMAKIIDVVNDQGRRQMLQPLFITCDPNRDDPASLKKYLAEFHPEIVGLTGSWDDIKRVCKAFRVYFSTPPNVKPGQDYLVDHSIFFYLMDPESNFVEVYGRNLGGEDTATRILGHIKDWGKAQKLRNK